MKRLIVRMARAGMAAVLAATFGCEIAPVGNGEVPELPSAGLQTALNSIVEAGLASAVLARVRDGDDEWVGSAGFRDLESEQPADADGYFRAGSVTKTFTATVVLQLTDEGRLSLDDPLEQHLPGVVLDGENITIRQLLNHTSGLPTGLPRGSGSPTPSATPVEYVEMIFATADPSFTPGTDWEYNNPGYIVLGLVIEEVTGNPFGWEVTDRILGPLGLAGTTIPGSDPTIPEPHARAYRAVTGGDDEEPQFVDITEFDVSLVFSAGEIISTTADLDRFYRAVLEGDLLSDTSMAAMRDAVDTGQPHRYLRYGLGLGLSEVACGVTTWGHSGSMPGFWTNVVHADNGRLLSVSANPLSQEFSREALTSLYEAVFCDA